MSSRRARSVARPRARPRIRLQSRPRPRPRPRPQPPVTPAVKPAPPVVQSVIATPTPTPTPPKRVLALLIGLEYVMYSKQGVLDRLPGCHADVAAMRQLLQTQFRLPSSDVTSYIDDVTPVTKSVMMQAIQTLVTQANQIGDCTVLFYYSGHGTQQRSNDAEEKDGLDECLVPSDFRDSGYISDDELHQTLLVPLKSTVKCVMVADACHSGTILDLPYLYTLANVTPPAGPALPVDCQVWSLSGCADHQTSASAFGLERSRIWRGALTVALEKALKANPALSIFDLWQRCRQYLQQHSFDQKAELCSNFAVPSQDTFL